MLFPFRRLSALRGQDVRTIDPGKLWKLYHAGRGNLLFRNRNGRQLQILYDMRGKVSGVLIDGRFI